MCDNINLNVNCFESRNNMIIESLLEVDDTVLKTIKKDKYTWVPGRADRAHGGFVKIISEDSDDTYFKAFILPRTTKLSFQRINVVDKASNNEFVVRGNGETLNISIDNKEVTYKLVRRKLLNPQMKSHNDVQLKAEKNKPFFRSSIPPHHLFPPQQQQNSTSPVPTTATVEFPTYSK